jgi:hypothetical protein
MFRDTPFFVLRPVDCGYCFCMRTLDNSKPWLLVFILCFFLKHFFFSIPELEALLFVMDAPPYNLVPRLCLPRYCLLLEFLQASRFFFPVAYPLLCWPFHLDSDGPSTLPIQLCKFFKLSSSFYHVPLTYFKHRALLPFSAYSTALHPVQTYWYTESYP